MTRWWFCHAGISRQAKYPVPRVADATVELETLGTGSRASRLAGMTSALRPAVRE
jgi:hypothetical protein